MSVALSIVDREGYSEGPRVVVGMDRRRPAARSTVAKVPGKGQGIVLRVARARAVEHNGLADIPAVWPARHGGGPLVGRAEGGSKAGLPGRIVEVES